MIIGAPKSIKEVPLFSKPEIVELTRGMDDTLRQGIPPEVPAAIPVGHLARIAATLTRFHEFIEEVASFELSDDPTTADEQIYELRQEAKKILAANIIEQNKEKAQGRLIFPPK